MLAPDTIEQGLARIDPAARALLELAYRRGLPDAEIAALSGGEAAQVRDRRRRAEAELAEALGADAGDVKTALPAGGYAVWLYNSPQDTRGLAATAQTSFDLSLALPRGSRRYRYVDVSREADTRPSHSGLSLLRLALARLEVR